MVSLRHAVWVQALAEVIVLCPWANGYTGKFTGGNPAMDYV